MHSLLIVLALCQAPDSHGEVALTVPSYQGVKASAPIDTKYHMRNEGGSNGAGLCVYCSVIMAGAQQGVADLALLKQSKLWKYVKARPGGSYPDKLARDLNTVYPFEQYGEKWKQYQGNDRSVLEKLTQQGYTVGATMNTGQLYGYRRIAHMVDVSNYKVGGYACIVDNNHPGYFHWMPSREFDRRDPSWLFWWEKLPPSAKHAIPGLWLASSLVLLFVVLSKALSRVRLVLVPVAAVLALCATPTQSQAQCANGQCATNYRTVQLIQRRPMQQIRYVQNTSTSAQVATEWTAGYEEYTAPDGGRWLRGKAYSAQHGSGWVFFRPDSWKIEAKPVETPAVEQDGSLTNYGIDLDKMNHEASGEIITNDPGFNPNASIGDTLIPKSVASPQSGWALPGSLAMLVGVLMFGKRRDG